MPVEAAQLQLGEVDDHDVVLVSDFAEPQRKVGILSGWTSITIG
jgi:hypothetical protein